MTPLRQRFIDELTRRNYSPRTIECYVAAVARTAKHFNRSPDQLTPDQLRDFQLHLIAQKTSWSQFNQMTCALRFLYRHVLNRADFVPFVVYGKKPKSLPVVLSPEEVRRVLDATPAGHYRLLLRLAYGCGLRIGELTNLRLADIDSSRHLLWVRQGKGNKDRGVPLPDELLEELRAYWRTHRPRDWFFNGSRGQQLHPGCLQRVFQKARRAAGLTKHATVHTLRHCYATHLLEAGIDLPTLQRLLGHAHLSTTMHYLHLRAERLAHIRSPLDLLDKSAKPPGHGPIDFGSGGRGPSGRGDVGNANAADLGPTPGLT